MLGNEKCTELLRSRRERERERERERHRRTSESNWLDMECWSCYGTPNRNRSPKDRSSLSRCLNVGLFFKLPQNICIFIFRTNFFIILRSTFIGHLLFLFLSSFFQNENSKNTSIFTTFNMLWLVKKLQNQTVLMVDLAICLTTHNLSFQYVIRIYMNLVGSIKKC